MALLYWLFYLSAAYGQFIPATYPVQTPSECGTGELLVDKELMETIELVQQQLAKLCLNPPTNKSCQQILISFPSAPSGYYQIAAPNCSLVQVYCDMEGINCGGEGGWMRVAFVNMTQSGTTCPQGLTQRLINGHNYCGRSIIGCQSTVFPTHGLNYSHVCGWLRGYQYGGPDAFHRTNDGLATSVDDNYVDGASITYDADPRKHIWTYAAGTRSFTAYKYDCPCNTGSSYTAPSFVGNDYYCESGKVSTNYAVRIHNDPLWDGQQCTNLEAPCCTHPRMPWFNKTLSETTTENIELRLCGNDSPTGDEDVLLEQIELYIR